MGDPGTVGADAGVAGGRRANSNPLVRSVGADVTGVCGLAVAVAVVGTATAPVPVASRHENEGRLRWCSGNSYRTGRRRRRESR